MSQCLGRLVRDTPKGENMLEFEQGGWFHIPLRCENFSRDGDLCDKCVKRAQKTAEKVQEIRGTTISGTHPSFLMGKVNGPIPFWSRIYDGAWFRLKLKSGCTVSEENMARIRKAAAKASAGVTTVEPEPMPGTAVVAAAAVPVPVPAPAVIAPLATAAVPAPAKKRIVAKSAQKKVVEVAPPPKAQVGNNPVDLSQREVLRIKVRKQEVDGSMYLLDYKKDKLYNMKGVYAGRLKDGVIDRDYPDSDA
jgi:hypothetical protein